MLSANMWFNTPNCRAWAVPSVDIDALGTRADSGMTDAMNADVEKPVLEPLRAIRAKPANDNGAATLVEHGLMLRSAIRW